MIALLVLLWLKRKITVGIFLLFFIVNLLLVCNLYRSALRLFRAVYLHSLYRVIFFGGMWLNKYLESTSASFIKAIPLSLNYFWLYLISKNKSVERWRYIMVRCGETLSGCCNAKIKSCRLP